MLSRTFGSVFRGAVGEVEDDEDEVEGVPQAATMVGGSNYAPIEIRAVLGGEHVGGYGGVCLRASFDGVQPSTHGVLVYQVRHEKLDEILVLTDP